MKHLLLLAPLLSGVTAGAVQDAPPIDDSLRQAALMELANDQPNHGVRTLARAVLMGLQELQLGQVSDPEHLADEIEFLLIVGTQVAAELDHARLWEMFYDGWEVDPRHGALRARFAWLKRDLATYAPLTRWEFVGPFDNERGRGMTRRTLAEKAPLDASYDGKVRPVSWRTTPQVAPRHGIVRFDRLVNPSEQACVLARTWVQSDGDQRVLLHLGVSGEFRVWLNGAQWAESLGEHAFAPDAFCTPLDLVDGWNEITLKVGAQEATPGFLARFGDVETGGPLVLETRDSCPEGVTPFEPEDPGRSIKDNRLQLRPGAMTRFHADDSPGSLLRRAMLMVDARSAPRKERPGHAEALAAKPANPDDWLATLLHLETLRVQGALATEEDVNPWLQALDAAMQTHGEKPMFLRWKSVHATRGQPTPHRALELIDEALELNPHSVPGRLRRATVLGEMGQSALAENELMRLAWDERIHDWASVMYTLHGVLPLGEDRRLQLLDLSASSGAAGPRQELAAVRRRRDRDRSAERRLRDLAVETAEDPWNLGIRVICARELISAGHAEAAFGVVAEALAYCPEDPTLHALQARAAIAMGDTERAVLALERELELDFSAEDDRRLLEHLRATGAPPFHVAFEVPTAEVVARHADAAPVDPDLASREVLLNQLVVEVNPDGTAKRYRRRVERVLSEAGARQLDRRGFRVFPGEEEIRVIEARVVRPDGSTDLARTGRTGARGELTIDLPPLEPGDLVDLSWRHDDLRPTFFGAYFGLDEPVRPDSRVALRETEIVLIAPAAMPLHLHQRGVPDDAHSVVELEDGRLQHTWVVRDLFPERRENLDPPAVETAARVQASTYPSWEAFGRWWWSLIAEEIRTSPEMEAEVRRLTEGLSEPRDQLRAIYDFVVSDVRYNAWEFGVHGYQPYSAPVVFSRRFGDCKDKAILMRAMLSVVGIEAWPVVIRAEGRRFEEDISLPLVSHFNHCIAYVPEQPGIEAMFLDGTARFHPLEVLPDSDRGARVVVVRDDGVQEVRIPFATAAENHLVDRVMARVEPDGGAQVTVEREPSGRWDPRERRMLSGDPDEQLETTRQYLSSRFGPLDGEVTLSVSDVEDLTQPLAVRLSATVERLCERREGVLELPTTFDTVDLLSGVATESERSSDLLLDVAWSRSSQIDYQLPGGATLGELPADVRIENQDALYERSVETIDGGARVTERLELRTQRIPPERYAAFRELARAIADAQRTRLHVEVPE